MKRYTFLVFVLACFSCAANAARPSRADFIGVTCGSKDNGKTCYGYDENYGDGTSDSCGRVPNGGPDFAMKLVYEITGDKICKTVIKTSDSRVMPPGTKFCTIILERKSDGYTYRFDDDEPRKIRKGFYSTKATKSCQPLIDAL